MTALSVRPTFPLATYGTVAAATAAICSPLVALAWFATDGGAEMASQATVTAWAGPARDLAGPLLTFASPDMVYAAYTLLTALAFPAIPLIALAVRAQRPLDPTRPERWGWRIALGGYLVFGTGLAAASVLLVAGAADSLVDVAFMSLMVPGLLVSLVGSTVLGVVFVRRRQLPRLSAWLLALAIPLWVAGSFVLGHNGFGMVPLFVAWAVAARHVRSGTPVAARG